jgi:superfamily I DNA/RNA helicase
MRERPGRVIKTWLDKEKIANYILDTEGNFGDWFILTRSNAELDNIFKYLEERGIPCETFKKKDLTADDLKEKMKNDTVKVLTIHTAKGLEANKVIVMSFNCYNEEETRVAYVAATRARDLLIWGIGSAPKPKRGYRQRAMVYDDSMDSWE